MPRYLHPVLLVATLLVCLPAAAVFEPERCRLERDGLPAAFGQCGKLSVPLDPQRPEGSTIELFVARIASLSATPRPDPLVLITGGPGQSTVDFYLQTRGAFEQIRRDRDLILLDQRGTGRSAAGFTCMIEDETLAMETASAALLADVAARCLDELERDPRFYTTSVAVRDLEQLRVALGVSEWNVYGISYGTRVAQHYLRRYPASTRAVILDGVVPAELVLGPDIAPFAQRALDEIFARCSSAEHCARRFGDLAARFAALRAQIAAAPISVDAPEARSGKVRSLSVGAAELNAVVRLMSYSAATASLLPLVISEAGDGNLAPLAAQAGLFSQAISGSLGFAMHNAVACTEDLPFLDAAGPAPDGDPYLGTMIVDGLVAICADWPEGVRDPDFKEPVVSDHPVLMLSGANDPITPPSYAAQAIAGGLRNAAHVIGPGQGHGMAGVGCVPRLMRVFLERPEPERLDAACVSREPVTPIFLDFSGPAP
jgi:pimeloyl-ACP methyl ester carboxylesterase